MMVSAYLTGVSSYGINLGHIHVGGLGSEPHWPPEGILLELAFLARKEVHLTPFAQNFPSFARNVHSMAACVA